MLFHLVKIVGVYLSYSSGKNRRNLSSNQKVNNFCKVAVFHSHTACSFALTSLVFMFISKNFIK